MFIFKNKPIIIDAFTFVPTTHELFPIRSAIYSLPDWWKELPATLTVPLNERINIKRGTMKNCSGFKELYKAGFMISMWTDIVINVPEDYATEGKFDAIMAQNSLTLIGGQDFATHGSEQYGNVYPDLFHCKIMSPWLINQKQDFKWVWTEPTWNMLEHNSNAKILPGVLDFKNQSQLNVNLFLKKSGQLFELQAGEPIAQITPLTEHKVEIKNHLVSSQEWLRISEKSGPEFKFFNGYNTLKNKRKQIQKEKKCPFDF